MKSKKALTGPALILLASMLMGGWFLQRGVAQDQNVYLQVRLLQEVVDRISDLYVDPVERDKLYDSAIEGVIRDLGDPNTSFLNATAYENLRIRTEGEYGGVGLEIVQRGEWITVVTPLPGTPGARAGIRAGDQIAEVESEPARGWSSTRAVEVLRGEPGTTVDVKIRRPHVDELIPFTLTRAIIQVRSVPFATMVEPGIGYVPVQGISETSETEVKEALASLRSQGMTGLVLDLRGNPGGLLDGGVNLADLFLDPGLTVVETRGRAAGQTEAFRTTDPQEVPGLPIVVLIDDRSASASEIIAGALQDHDRALVVGWPSYGKGSVQSLYRLTGGNVLRLTTARWYTPSGRSIQRPFHDEDAGDEEGVLTLDGGWLERTDLLDRPAHQTASGRTVYGGGGIAPDILVFPDTLADGEEVAVRKMYEEAGRIYSAIFNFAVTYIQEHPELQVGFELTDAVMASFYTALAESGLEMDREVVDGAGRFVRHQLGREIANQKWGDEGAFRSQLPSDHQLERAVELLRGARSPGELFQGAGLEPEPAPDGTTESGSFSPLASSPPAEAPTSAEGDAHSE